MRRPSFAALLCASGCFYNPGSYAGLEPFAGKRVELHCVDLAVALTEDRLAPAPVIRYSFGNRCTHATVVDLASIRVVARAGDGTTTRALSPYDPKQELQALSLDGWWHGREEISYRTEGVPPSVVCAEVGHVDRGDPAPRDRWICLGMAEAEVVP